MTPTSNDFYLTNFIQIFIDSCDMSAPYVVMIPIGSDNYSKTGKFSYSGTDADGVKKSFTFDFKTKNFYFAAQNVNLSRLSCPLSVGVVVTSFEASTAVDESIVNGSKPIPINFLMGVKNSVRVDKTKITRDKNTGSITKVIVSGGFSVKDINDANLAAKPFVVTVGSQTYMIPAKTFKNTRGRSACSKVKLPGGEIAAAIFDFNKSMFTLTIKGTKITDSAVTADFKMEFGKFSEDAEVSLP